MPCSPHRCVQEELLKDKELLVLATQGAKALIAYTYHKLAAAAGPSSSNSSVAAAVKRCVPAFEEMALSTCALVSWLVQAAGLHEVTDRMELFEPLGRPTGHHKDLLILLGMGHAWVGIAVLVWMYRMGCACALWMCLRHWPGGTVRLFQLGKGH